MEQHSQCSYKVTLRRVHVTVAAVGKNLRIKYFCARASVGDCVRACVGALAWACTSARVALFIEHATCMRHIPCNLSGFTNF